MFARGFNDGLGFAADGCDRILATLYGVAIVAVGIPTPDAVGPGAGLGGICRLTKIPQT